MNKSKLCKRGLLTRLYLYRTGQDKTYQVMVSYGRDRPSLFFSSLSKTHISSLAESSNQTPLFKT